jgi:hypothetical protein
MEMEHGRNQHLRTLAHTLDTGNRQACHFTYTHRDIFSLASASVGSAAAASDWCPAVAETGRELWLFHVPPARHFGLQE